MMITPDEAPISGNPDLERHGHDDVADEHQPQPMRTCELPRCALDRRGEDPERTADIEGSRDLREEGISPVTATEVRGAVVARENPGTAGCCAVWERAGRGERSIPKTGMTFSGGWQSASHDSTEAMFRR